MRDWATSPLLPAWALITAAHPRWSRDWRERWGVDVAPAAIGSVWLHAASVGEIAAAEALIAHLHGPILLTADTDTGAARAREIAARAGPRVVAAIRPVDHAWTLAPLWAEARPRAIVFVEGAFWPGLAELASREGVPIARVSARAGEGTRRRAGRAYRAMVAPTSLVVARDEHEAVFFRTLGAPVVIGGDLKASGPTSPSPLAWSRPFVVGASTRPGDEEALLDAIPAGHQLLLAPRHRERFEAVATRLNGRNWVRRTSLQRDVPADVDIVLLDTSGELAACLRGAAAAFVGGTFDAKIGGHSPWEAARQGVPVVAGPEIASNAQAFADVGAVQVRDRSELRDALAAAVSRQATSTASDASARTAAELALLLDRAPAPEATPRPWLAPIAALWMAGTTARQAAWDRLGTPFRLPVPVIGVGSTNARGPGKTSTAHWVAERLRERGYVVGVALRGYARSRAGSDVRTSTVSCDAADLGDEGALFAEAGFLVAAGTDRVACGRALVAAGATVVVLDDGFTYRRLHRDVDLLVVDARFPAARGPFPAGERRESKIVPARVTGVVVHHHDEPGAVAVEGAVATRIPGAWHPRPPFGPVAAFAGIARPADFFSTLDVPVARRRVLRDHQSVDDALAAELVAWADGLPLVCTAKDRVRLPESLRSRVFSRDVELHVHGFSEDWWP